MAKMALSGPSTDGRRRDKLRLGPHRMAKPDHFKPIYVRLRQRVLVVRVTESLGTATTLQRGREL